MSGKHFGYVVTTLRLPREVHERMKEYVKDFNYEVRWWEKKMSRTLLVGKALVEYMRKYPVEVIHKTENEGGD